MNTLYGIQAIETAEPHGARLYDRERHRAVSVADALQQIEAHRSVHSFILPFWPDGEDEADALVLRAFRKLLTDRHQSEASMDKLFPNSLEDGPIHPDAAEGAASRLVEAGKLGIARGDVSVPGAVIYRILREIRLADAFADELRAVACSDCAQLHLGGPFHEDCLMNVIDLLKRHDFTMLDISEAAPEASEAPIQWLKVASKTSENVQKLAKSALTTSLAASRKWQGVWKSVATRTSRETLPAMHGSDAGLHVQPSQPEPLAESELRTAITQTELIHYLQSVDIVPTQADSALRLEHAQTLRHLFEKDREIDDLRKQRAYVEQQFAELQRDMDTVLQALQIAKRHDRSADPVIDALYADGSDTGQR